MTTHAKINESTGLHHLVDDIVGPMTEPNAFLEALTTRGLSPLTVRSYAYDLVVIYRWLADSGRKFAELDQAGLLEFVANERKREAHPSSINHRLTACRMLFSYWFPNEIGVGAGTSLPAGYYRGQGRDRRLGMYQLQKKRTLKLHVKVPRKLVSPLKVEEVRKFLAGLRRYREIAIVHLMLLCGLRSREILQLERSDVSVLEGSIRVMGKGSKERMVPLGELTIDSIEHYVKHERPQACPTNVLFVCLQGKHRGCAMTPAGLRSIFRTRRRKTEVTRANPHRFRHTFGASMARSGMGLPALQKLLGHESLETSLIYVNLSMSDLREAYLKASAEIQKRYGLE